MSTATRVTWLPGSGRTRTRKGRWLRTPTAKVVTAPEGHADSAFERERERERARAIQGVSVHLFVFLVINGALFLINWATRGPHGTWWFYWPLIGWGAAIVIHLGATFLPMFSSDWVEGRAARMVGRRPESVDR